MAKTFRIVGAGELGPSNEGEGRTNNSKSTFAFEYFEFELEVFSFSVKSGMSGKETRRTK